jgi:hypothetical protein
MCVLRRDRPICGCTRIHAGSWPCGAMRRLRARTASPGKCTKPRVVGHARRYVLQVLHARGRGARPIRTVPATSVKKARTENRDADTKQAGVLARLPCTQPRTYSVDSHPEENEGAISHAQSHWNATCSFDLEKLRSSVFWSTPDDSYEGDLLWRSGKGTPRHGKRRPG